MWLDAFQDTHWSRTQAGLSDSFWALAFRQRTAKHSHPFACHRSLQKLPAWPRLELWIHRKECSFSLRARCRSQRGTDGLFLLLLMMQLKEVIPLWVSRGSPQSRCRYYFGKCISAPTNLPIVLKLRKMPKHTLYYPTLSSSASVVRNVKIPKCQFVLPVHWKGHKFHGGRQFAHHIIQQTKLLACERIRQNVHNVTVGQGSHHTS